MALPNTRKPLSAHGSSTQHVLSSIAIRYQTKTRYKKGGTLSTEDERIVFEWGVSGCGICCHGDAAAVQDAPPRDALSPQRVPLINAPPDGEIQKQIKKSFFFFSSSS
ncbi:hypothetical protein NPIL_542831 [Nephila pilipes]|uniref:Uncharacterized protein n=1 Tax=Nephila pilipes TaxID=299642 RepID=A0A8X6TTM1_NEPPI|nr:hypothetical protein NPIL_542831 [Nephila pilipes]